MGFFTRQLSANRVSEAVQNRVLSDRYPGFDSGWVIGGKQEAVPRGTSTGLPQCSPFRSCSLALLCPQPLPSPPPASPLLPGSSLQDEQSYQRSGPFYLQPAKSWC